MNRLEVIRKIKGLVQWDIVKNTGIPQTTISLVERGHKRPTQKMKEKIAMALGVGVEDIDWPEVGRHKRWP